MSTASSSIEIYDSEILRIETVLEILNRKRGTQTNMDGFRNECIDRFAKIGFVVDVRTYATDVQGMYAFDLQIESRTENSKWDPDQMVHEVTNDILELGTGGVIKSGTKAEAAMIHEAEQRAKREHKD